MDWGGGEWSSCLRGLNSPAFHPYYANELLTISHKSIGNEWIKSKWMTSEAGRGRWEKKMNRKKNRKKENEEEGETVYNKSEKEENGGGSDKKGKGAKKTLSSSFSSYSQDFFFFKFISRNVKLFSTFLCVAGRKNSFDFTKKMCQ